MREFHVNDKVFCVMVDDLRGMTRVIHAIREGVIVGKNTIETTSNVSVYYDVSTVGVVPAKRCHTAKEEALADAIIVLDGLNAHKKEILQERYK